MTLPRRVLDVRGAFRSAGLSDVKGQIARWGWFAEQELDGASVLLPLPSDILVDGHNHGLHVADSWSNYLELPPMFVSPASLNGSRFTLNISQRWPTAGEVSRFLNRAVAGIIDPVERRRGSDQCTGAEPPMWTNQGPLASERECTEHPLCGASPARQVRCGAALNSDRAAMARRCAA